MLMQLVEEALALASEPTIAMRIVYFLSIGLTRCPRIVRLFSFDCASAKSGMRDVPGDAEASWQTPSSYAT
jgi:hypothetical protein